MAEGRKGGLSGMLVVEVRERGGASENWGEEVSSWRMASREEGESQGGGRMLARFWRLRRRASQRGRGVRWGGIRGVVGPWCGLLDWRFRVWRSLGGWIFGG